VRYGFLGPIKLAVIEASEVTEYGEIVLTSAVGAAPTFCHRAEKIVIELNRHHPPFLRGVHDLFEPEDPPRRSDIPIFSPSDRIGQPTIHVDPSRIAGIVETNAPDEVGGFAELSPVTAQIGHNVAEFLAREIDRGMIPSSFLPVQSGVGDTANAVLMAMADHPRIPNFLMYTEVIQDAVIALMRKGRIPFVSGCSLTVPPPTLAGIYEDWKIFPLPPPPPTAGDHEQPRSRPPHRHDLDQHRHRSGPRRKCELHPCPRPKHDERHRRLRRFRPRRLPLDVHLPLHRQGRKNQHHRPNG
jgi:acetyl-CoA hydrolase